VVRRRPDDAAGGDWDFNLELSLNLKRSIRNKEKKDSKQIFLFLLSDAQPNSALLIPPFTILNFTKITHNYLQR
jgi:hypothetical protein